MKYFILIILILIDITACAKNTKDSTLFTTCDIKMNDKREELAEKLFEESKIKELIKLSNPCAEAGDSYYQFSLGIIYMNSSMMEVINSKVDYNRAYKWLTKAANQGYEDAILILIDAYSQGDMGIEKNTKKLKYWKERLNNMN